MTSEAAGGTAAATPSPADEAAHMSEMRLQRNLKIVVAVLGLMIVAGLATVVGRIIYLASHGGAKGASPQASTAAAVPATASAPLDIPVDLPKGARIVSVSVSANRLAIHHESAWGTGITIIDTDTGKALANVRQTEAVPQN